MRVCGQAHNEGVPTVKNEQSVMDAITASKKKLPIYRAIQVGTVPTSVRKSGERDG